MAEDPEAARIQRERERRTAVERVRIEQEARSRRTEIARLDRPPASRGSAARRPAITADTDRAGRASRSPAGAERSGPAPVPGPVSPPETRPVPREIGGSIPLRQLDAFLRPDLIDRFDLLAVNTLPLPRIASEARREPERLESIANRAEALMLRVKREVDDPLTMGAFLRDQTVLWYEQSAIDPEWTGRMAERWGGLIADSKSVGGRTIPWVNNRLAGLREIARREGRLSGRIRRKLSRDRIAQAAGGRTASQQINAEVAQAILDDLAGHARVVDAPTPLVRLSELAVRRQVATVDDSLSVIFSGPESGPFVVLHPNRYPQCEEMVIRPPGPGASGAALAFTLAPGRTGRKGAGRPRGGSESGTDSASRDAAEGSSAGEDADIDASTLWEARAVSRSAWQEIVGEAKRSRSRLDPPPKDYRNRAAYATLRELALEDAEFRKAFLGVKWRGRPAGLPLLVALLQKGSLAPEVATDHEYLESELGELVQGDPDWRPPDAVWTAGPWRITREGTHQEGFRYRAAPVG